MDISVLGLAFDFAAGCQGMNMGPAALRHTGLLPKLRELGHTVNDFGDLWPTLEDRQADHQIGHAAHPKVQRYLSAALEKVRELPADAFTLTLGGDHAVGFSTVAGRAAQTVSSQATQPTQPKRIGLIWVDAHADFNTPESSPSGNIHGMPVMHLCGVGHQDIVACLGDWRLNPRDIVMIGLRSVDTGERALLQEYGVKTYSMTEVDHLGMPRIAAETADYLADADSLHVSLDADAFDPSVCPALGTPVLGGLSYREGRTLLESLHDTGRVGSMDLVEVNSVRDEHNRTAEVMCDMALSMLGHKLL